MTKPDLLKLSIPLSLLLLVLMVVVAAALSIARPVWAETAAACSPQFSISVTFTHGATWEMCWEERLNEGILFHSIYYTPVGGPRRSVLAQANLAQLHVPYDDNSSRFHDLSDYGLGGFNLNNLQAGDCPGGTLLRNGSKNVLCQKIEPRGYAYKYYGSQKQGEQLSLFSVSHIGAYNYVVRWTFMDDGTIEPAVGSTGRLQLYTNDPRHGWHVRSQNPQYGTNHTHNVYWRLDFDLDGPANDLVQEIQFMGPNRESRPMLILSHPTETARRIQPNLFRFWRVVDREIRNPDGHNISYEIEPIITASHRGPEYEPWTQNDLYVTQYRACERWVSHNPTAGGCGRDVTEFVNGETITDLVVWYGNTFHHVPRDEDEPNMPAHWQGFFITPRDWTATNPIR
jgi:primary-amine oxidase